MKQSESKTHEKYMRICVALAKEGTEAGDFPFGSVVVFDGRIVGRGYNRAISEKKVCLHAEILALTEAQKKLSKNDLSKCFLYSTVEPCPMCSFAIRELNIGTVVFGLRSPYMGGYSNFQILKDEALRKVLPEIFSPAPKILPDVLKGEVIKGWREWNEKSWNDFYKRGLFT